jgi:hypothetical protein
MNTDILRRAADIERAEWGIPDIRRIFGKAAEMHLALADWLDELAETFDTGGYEDSEVEDFEPNAVKVARLIVGDLS